MKEKATEKIKNPKYQILIARHNENVDYLKYLPNRENRDYEVIVSNSGNKDDIFFSDRTIIRENIGREAGHYLNFIASEYEKMADTVIFLQAGWSVHVTNISSILELFYGKPNFPFPMSFLGTNANTYIPKVPKWTKIEWILKSAWQDEKWTDELYLKENGQKFTIDGSAQFYIKKEILLKRPPEHYLRPIECDRDPDVSIAHDLELHWPNMFDLSCLHEDNK
jgi:hypothetical protein